MKIFFLSILIISIFHFGANAQKIWGSTELGGVEGIGLIYSYDYSTNTLASEFEFPIENKGGYASYSGLKKASNGKIYGVTNKGDLDRGVLFEYDHITKNYTIKYNFPDS